MPPQKSGGPGFHFVLEGEGPEYEPWIDSILLRELRPTVAVMAQRTTPSLVHFTYDGEATEIEFVADQPVDMSGLPCRKECGAIIAGFKTGPPFPATNIPGLPTGDGGLPRMEEFAPPRPGSGSRAYVRFRDAPRADYSYDIIGDGTQLIEYTYDGRAVGLRLLDWETGALVGPEVPYQSQVRALLTAYEVPLCDTRMYLDDFSYGLGPNGWLRAPTNGLPLTVRLSRPRADRLPVNEVDLRGDGRVLVTTADTVGVVSLVFRGVEHGVDLSGVPERVTAERILRHVGIRLL
jgi:hypothetical protein